MSESSQTEVRYGDVHNGRGEVVGEIHYHLGSGQIRFAVFHSADAQLVRRVQVLTRSNFGVVQGESGWNVTLPPQALARFEQAYPKVKPPLDP